MGHGEHAASRVESVQGFGDCCNSNGRLGNSVNFSSTLFFSFIPFSYSPYNNVRSRYIREEGCHLRLGERCLASRYRRIGIGAARIEAGT